MIISYSKIYKTIGYEFKNEALIKEALTHPSLSSERKLTYSNQRLEFLGDAVVQVIVTEYLYNKFPGKSEGELTKLRAQIVQKETLANFARFISLNESLLLGKGEREQEGNLRDSNLCDAFEALIGAVYLDSDFFVARRVFFAITGLFFKTFDFSRTEKNPKGQLQEYLQKKNRVRPEYVVKSVEGEGHNPHFNVELFIDGQLMSSGSGRNLKQAEADAAAAALKKLNPSLSIQWIFEANLEPVLMIVTFSGRNRCNILQMVYIIVDLERTLKNINYNKSISIMNIISYQHSLFQRRKNTNHKEYRDLINKLESVDKILTRSGIEFEFAEAYLEKILEAKRRYKTAESKLSSKEITRHTSYAIKALRCTYLMHELGTSFRETSFLIASSEDFQRFTLSGDFAFAKCPGKSSLQEFSEIMPYEQIHRLNDLLYSEFTNSFNIPKYELVKPLDTEVILMDSFCLQSNIHFPVDWVLMRDAVRTFIKSILCIRRHGLTHRIPNPAGFTREMNTLCIEMTNSRRKQNAQKNRKWIFRKMKRVVRIVKDHAVRYRKILDLRWNESDLTRPETERILKRLNNVLEKLPEAIRQANERIISGRLTDTKEKILSLYDESASVVVRGKAGAEVEFGNELLIAEQKEGFIVAYELYKEKTADTNKLQFYLEHLKSGIHTLVADRGFSSKANSKQLEKHKINNGVCPRSVSELIEKRKDPEFCKLQTRRSQTEGRIAALKRFISKFSPCTDFKGKQSNISWAVLSHNLNLLARQLIAAQNSKKDSAA